MKIAAANALDVLSALLDEAAKEEFYIQEITVDAVTFEHAEHHLRQWVTYAPATNEDPTPIAEFRVAVWAGGVDGYVTVKKGKSRYET